MGSIYSRNHKIYNKNPYDIESDDIVRTNYFQRTNSSQVIKNSKIQPHGKSIYLFRQYK